ncbi:MAG: FkbM family methyltransferase, partial [Chloroflexi bacterium]|nr:FkbM family methyltransferase [Chloroflexota bacterium]
YLPDDDALVPGALGTLATVALDGAPKVVSWEDAPYYYPNWNQPRLRNVALLFYFGQPVLEDIASGVYRGQCARFDFAWSSPLPKLLNCVADRAFFEQWRQRLGRLFFPVAPDYSFAWIATHVTSAIRVVHRPLSVRGISDYSIGSNAGLGEASKEFYREFGEFDFFGDAPLELPISLNQLAATFARASRSLAAQGIDVARLDMPAFLIACARQLYESRHLLEDWPRLAARVREAAGKVSSDLLAEVEATLDQADDTSSEPTETIGALRGRTAQMALEDPLIFRRALAAHHGSAECARCALGLEPGTLAASNWDYIYLIGDELGVFDPHAVSSRVEAYYELLSACRQNKEIALSERTDEYDQSTDVRLLMALLTRISNKVAVDVGAERGSFVHAFLDAGVETVYAVEPYPQNVELLRQQFGASPSVKILDVALGDQDGPTTLYVAEDKTGLRNDAYHSLVAFDETPTIRRIDELPVMCRSLESLAAEGVLPDRVGVLKIDAERSDFAIVRGMGRVTPAVIMLEYWDDLSETVGAAEYRLSEVAEWLRIRGYGTFVAVKRHDEFEVLQVNDSTTHPGDWGNAIFVRDDVVAQVSDLIFSAAVESQERLVRQAKMFATECRDRLSVINDQQRRIEYLEKQQREPTSSSNPVVVMQQTRQTPSIEDSTETTLPAVEAAERNTPLMELVTHQTDLLESIQARLLESTRTYEQVRAELESEFEVRLESAERQRADAESAAEARLNVIEEQRRALDHYRFWSWSERIRRFKSPKLGTLYQYPPRTVAIPRHYLRPAAVPEAAPTISIVTPSLNQGAFIERTIKSVLDQKYPKLEYIVQDALSTDETPAILDQYASRLTHVDSRQDTGFANGINMGFSHSTGEVMGYLNSDDILLPGAMQFIAGFFAAHPEVDVVYGHRIVVDEYDAEIGRWVLPRHEDEVLSWADFVPQETLFWRRAIWDRAGGAIDENFRFAIDWDLLIRFRDAGARIQRLPRFLGAFRVHPHQKTSLSLQELGAHEMNELRKRSLGRVVSESEVNEALANYLRKSIVYDKLYRFGVLRY